MTRILVCGSRDFDDRIMFQNAMEDLFLAYSNIELVSGHARGADRMAEDFANENDIAIRVFPAQWNIHGNRAGMIRNGQMFNYVKKADTPVVAAFWDGKSRGTADMIRRAEKDKTFKLHVFRY